MIDQLATIDAQMKNLKQRREKVQLQQAITFMREAQKIFQTDFSPNVALCILSETWSTASEKQQAEWKKRGSDFRPSSVQSSSKKPQSTEPADQEN